ncbi:MAG: amidohydrolase [Burkholderiales bacterium]|nr:amidohydrolase [Burkholderiales bacterium]
MPSPANPVTPAWCIDIHSHFFPRAAPDFAQKFGADSGPWVTLREDGAGHGMMMLGDKPFRPVHSALWDTAARLAEMDASHVETQIICATPVMFAYDAPAEQAAYVARAYNDLALEFCASSGGRIRALAQVPLQDTDLACTELTRAMRAGCVGVQIGNHVGPREMDDPGIVRFLAHCAAEGAAVLVHPWDMMGGERLKRWMSAWTVAMPAETQFGIMAMILGGAFDRLPPDLRICFAHGGGGFPYLLGRLENAWHRRDIVRGESKHPPSHYLNRFSVDSAVFDPRALRLLIDTMGAKHIMVGSDAPFPLGEAHIGNLVRNQREVSPADRAAILRDNATAFFRL